VCVCRVCRVCVGWGGCVGCVGCVGWGRGESFQYEINVLY